MVGLMFPSPFRMCSSFTSLMHYFFHFFEWQQFIYVLMSVRLAYALRKTFWLSHLKKYFVTAIIFHSFNKCSPVFTCLLGACVSCLCVPSLFLHQFLSWLSLIVSFFILIFGNKIPTEGCLYGVGQCNPSNLTTMGAIKICWHTVFSLFRESFLLLYMKCRPFYLWNRCFSCLWVPVLFFTFQH